MAKYDEVMMWLTILGGMVIIFAYFTLLWVLAHATVGAR